MNPEAGLFYNRENGTVFLIIIVRNCVWRTVCYIFIREWFIGEPGIQRTGNVTGPHLHFELLHAGIRYDPTEALGLA